MINATPSSSALAKAVGPAFWTKFSSVHVNPLSQSENKENKTYTIVSDQRFILYPSQNKKKLPDSSLTNGGQRSFSRSNRIDRGQKDAKDHFGLSGLRSVFHTMEKSTQFGDGACRNDIHGCGRAWMIVCSTAANSGRCPSLLSSS